MRGYENYRDSKVMWIGSIPAHWEEKFLQQVCTVRKEKNTGNRENNVLSLSYGHVIRKRDTYSGLVASDFSTYQIVRKGDIILRFTDLQNDHKSLRTGLVQETGIITSAYLCIVPTINNSYLHYLLHAYDVMKIFYGMGTGVRQSISYRDVTHMYIPVPPKDEQDQIARFLDWKITAIDKLISIRREELRNLAELRKVLITREVMRGNCEHVKIKRLFKIFSGTTPDSYEPEFWDGNIIWITPADFQTKDKYIYHGAKYITESGFRSCSTSLVPSGSIIFTKRAPVGKVAISRTELCTNQGCLSCVPLEGVVPEYFYYVMSINAQEFESLSAGATFKEISLSRFRNVSLPCPPITEQQRIANYLDRICAQIDSAITNFTQQIDTLKELKARLISDTVTGKIDVRNITVPEQEKIS